MSDIYKDSKTLLPSGGDDVMQDSVGLAPEYRAALLFHILKFLLKRKTSGRFKSTVFRFNGKDVEFYHVQYVHKLELTVRTKGMRRIAPPRYATPTLIRKVLNSYPPLDSYFLVAAPDGKTYSVWVRADAVDEAVKWLILVIQKLYPVYLEKFYMLADCDTYLAYLDFTRRLGDEKLKNIQFF
jgi:hypothetical protein